ncbi:V-type proton ATPase subunit E [BD1-7 clade bacterium]|uniref:V-type proton ATPase subunit E n=1 Tax=BD1-7 clade bacterium TaxID=2029982 RepID=A0A5S9QF79_9GAMM|nr:V-type proton ATPase subunit E [BD1-7 clade bacterium]CAA0117132.1 V-type proton ATPase subunit E [BD1-7 clade bacterium]
MGDQQTDQVSSGVETLIVELRDKGVNAGKYEAQQIIDDAKQHADAMLKQAKDEASKLVEDAQKEAEFIRASGAESLQLAFRDTLLKLKQQLLSQFSDNLKRMTQHELKDPDTLRKLVLEVASKTQKIEKNSVIMLPAHAEAVEDLRKSPEKLSGGPLIEMISEQTRGMLRDGIEFSVSENIKSGIKIISKDSKVEIQLDDSILSDILLEYLQPRFRALLDGVLS